MTPDEELAARLRALEAERRRPEVASSDASTEELLAQLIKTLHQAFLTTTDSGRWAGMPARVAEFERLRGLGLSIDQATTRMGLSRQTGYRYDRRLRAQKGAA